MVMAGDAVAAPTPDAAPPQVGVTAPSRRPAGRATLIARIQKIDVRSTWQVAAGAFLVPLGVVVILISWYGSAHTAYVQQQIPYLVSGSFIGLGLMFVGGLLYWAHWLYRIYDQADLNHATSLAHQEELLERLIDAVIAGQAVGPGVTDRSTKGSARANRPRPEAVAVEDQHPLVATATGASVHRSDCPIVARHPAGLRRLSAREAAGRPRCRICRPGEPAVRT
jgi:hypothetical protein